MVRHFRAAWILARTQFTTARFPTFREKWEAVLQPPVGDISILDFHKADKLVEIGYEYTITEWQRFIGVADDCTVFL